MDARRLRAGQLARFAGVSPAAVSEWLAGKRRPRPEMLRAIAHPLGVTYEEAMQAAGYLSGERPTPSGMEPIPLDQLPVGELLSVMEDLIPVYYIGRAELGPGAWMEPVVYLPRGMLGRRKRVGRVIASGECMEPDIHDGETVLVDLEASAKPGDVVAATTPDGTVIKRLVQNGEGMELRGNNGQRIPIGDGVRVQGVVFFVGRLLL